MHSHSACAAANVNKNDLYHLKTIPGTGRMRADNCCGHAERINFRFVESLELFAICLRSEGFNSMLQQMLTRC